MPLRNRFMKIAIDIRALMEGKTTGVEVYLVNLLHELFKIDSKNQYVLFANSFRAVSLPSFNYSNVKLIVTKYPNKIFNLSQKLGFLQMEKLLGPVDLFFSPHWRVVALKSSTPLVVTFHDLFFEIIPEFFTARRRLWHAFMDYPKAARRAKKIIAVSDNTKKDLEDLYGIENSKIKVVYPGMNPPRPSAPSLNQYFLYFGTLEPRKNIQTVIAAYERYARESSVKRKLVIAGSSGWKTKLSIPQSLADAIIVKINPDEQEKSALYQNAFAFLFPSFYEGFGFPILEAARSGKVVVASRNSSLEEIGKDFALLANAFRPAQFARLMLELEHDENLRIDLEKRGWRIAEKFNWRTAAEQTLRVFEEAAV